MNQERISIDEISLLDTYVRRKEFFRKMNAKANDSSVVREPERKDFFRQAQRISNN